jgi:hypothetical protein
MTALREGAAVAERSCLPWPDGQDRARFRQPIWQTAPARLGRACRLGSTTRVSAV